MTRKSILFTGGGTTGHVAVNLALIPRFVQDGWTVGYAGSHTGIEKRLVSKIEGVRYTAISTGKLRRYFDWRSLRDPANIVAGVIQAYFAIKKQKPNIIFSKGGYVSFPVVIGGWLNGIPVVQHESDVTLGLANRLCLPFVTRLYTTFPETGQHIRPGKVQHIGPIIRESLMLGDSAQAYSFCGFVPDKPVLLVVGGSSGSRSINTAIRASLDRLLLRFQVVHICGSGQIDDSIDEAGYRQYEYLDERFADVLVMSDIVLSRAGSNAIFEFLCLRKPMVLVPLSRSVSRGDQVLNAECFKQHGYCQVVQDSDLSEATLLQAVESTYDNRMQHIRDMDACAWHGSPDGLFRAVQEVALP